jgi:potassium/hydrogen antiporter
MEIYIILLALALTIFIGFIANYLFRRFRAPDVLILITLGFLFGPGVLGIVDETAASSLSNLTPLIAALALAIIMFDAGLDLHVHDVIKSFPATALYGTIIFVLSLLVTAIISMQILGWGTFEGLLLGTILGGISAAIVIPLVANLSISKKTKAGITLEAALTDVLMVVLATSIMFILSTGNSSLGRLLFSLLLSFLVAGVFGFFSGVLWLWVLSKLSRQPFSYMITLAALLTVYAGAELLLQEGGGGAVAVLVFGLTLGNKAEVEKRLHLKKDHLSFDEEIKGFHGQISFFVRTFFFVFLGIVMSLIDFTLDQLLLGVIIFIALLAVRYGVIKVSRRLGSLKDQDTMTILLMMPRGLTSAVLASVPLSMGIVSTIMGDLIVGIVAIVILLTSGLVSIGAFYIDRLERKIETSHHPKFGVIKK